MITLAKKAAQANETIARAILDEYQPKTVAEMQDALKDIFGPMGEQARRETRR